MKKLNRSSIGLITGLASFLLILILPLPAGMQAEALRAGAVAVLMAVFWITEAIPIPATALLPILLYPLLGIQDGSTVTGAYANHLIYLFLGGFLIAVTIEKWGLHRRIALYTIRLAGVTPARITLGFMIATAFLSMWISNTATTMMMVTIGLAVLKQLQINLQLRGGSDGPDGAGLTVFGTGLMLSIGYAASIGGIATLIGTPPNAILAGVLENTYGYSISFLSWMLYALPFSLIMLLICWVYLTRIAYPCGLPELPGGRETIEAEIRQLGKRTTQENAVACVAVLVALMWVLRGLLDNQTLPMVRDSTIAIGGALLLFIIPVDLKQREFLLDWNTAVKIPWDILILFGGGFALAQGFSDTGLTTYLAEQLTVLKGSNIALTVAVVTCAIVFLTEITSNTATASLSLPVMGALAVSMLIHPLALMVGVAMAASCAFMLPVATPPNAIVFSSRRVTIQQMARAGLWLNFISIVVITLFITLVMPMVWGIDIGSLPADW